jgi:CheY-like chemotaxis protein
MLSDSGIDDAEGWQGEGTLLIADDENAVRAIAGRMCELLGFEVLYAEDGIEALDVFRQYHQKIASVLLDITMPLMDGVEVMHKMRDIDPHVPIILVSGYSEIEVALLADKDHPDGFVQKPFRIQTLKNTLFQVL